MARRTLPCRVCGCQIQKDEAHAIDESTFALASRSPAEAGIYCSGCFETGVRLELDRYIETVARAKDVNVFYTSQGKESRFVRRVEKPVRVENCADREEAVMRLAFLAAEAGKNSLVDVELKSTKIRDGAYQTSEWAAVGVPAHIEASQLQRRYVGSPN